MGLKNYLIEGISGTGKTTVAQELERRGYHVIHGDRQLAYKGDPKTGETVDDPIHENSMDQALWKQRHWIWDIEKVKSIITDKSHAISFFCGGSRNFSDFTDLLDGIYILEVDDIETLHQRIDQRVALDPTEFGGKPEEKELVAQLHATKESIPDCGITIDATAPIEQIVDQILEQCK